MKQDSFHFNIQSLSLRFLGLLCYKAALCLLKLKFNSCYLSNLERIVIGSLVF